MQHSVVVGIKASSSVSMTTHTKTMKETAANGKTTKEGEKCSKMKATTTTTTRDENDDFAKIQALIANQEQLAAIDRDKRRNYTKKQEEDEHKFATQFLKARTEQRAAKEMTRKEANGKITEKEIVNNNNNKDPGPRSGDARD